MTPNPHREEAIRALSRKLIRCLGGKNVDVCGAALATVVGTFLLDLSPTEESALGGLDAIKGDAALFIRSAHIHKGTAQ